MRNQCASAFKIHPLLNLHSLLFLTFVTLMNFEEKKSLTFKEAIRYLTAKLMTQLEVTYVDVPNFLYLFFG